MRTVTTVALTVFGFALVTLSWSSCAAVLVGEHYSWTLVLLFFGGLIAGGPLLTAAAVRIRRPRSADAEMDLARGLGVVGMSLALGAGGVGVLLATAPLGLAGVPAGALGGLIGAVLLFGVALTIGAFGLLAWAANGPHSDR